MSKLTKKHYEAIAAIVRGGTMMRYPTGYIAVQQEAIQAEYRNTAGELADYFASENPKFDRARFLVACGVDSTPCGVQS